VRRLSTVRVHVTVAAVIVVAFALVVGGAWVINAHRVSLINGIDTAARLRARDVAATIANGTLAPSLAVTPGDDSIVQVVDAQGKIVATSVNIEGEPRLSTLDPGPVGDTVRTVQNLPVGNSSFRVVALRAPAGSSFDIVYVAASLDTVNTSVRSLIRLLLIGLPILLLLVGGTTWVVSGRALQPVEAIRRQVEAIGAEDLQRRVPEPNTVDEVGRLARTMNAMLGRLEDATDRQRRFVADASHELRSPLTGIRARLEVDLAHPDGADWQATEREVLDDAIRLQHLVDDLLALAASDASASDQSAPEPVDLDEIVLDEARRLRSRTSQRIDTAGVSGAQIVGHAEPLARAVRNLLDNAASHAQSMVIITLRESEASVVLTVADDGPGIAPEQHARIFERFARIDDGRARSLGGTGLGLAITHDVVVSHGGTITVDNVPGARFTVCFPLSPPPSPA
jgi:signal transduction histidine kinase